MAAMSFACEETLHIVVYIDLPSTIVVHTVLPLPIVLHFQDSTAATYEVAVEVDCRVGELDMPLLARAGCRVAA
jgi:hypothetical protein